MPKHVLIALIIGAVAGGAMAEREIAARAPSLAWSATDEFERAMFCSEWRHARGIDREAFVWHLPGDVELIDDCATPRRWQLRVMP